MPTKNSQHSHMVAKAIQIACSVHAGQVDKGGDPYIFHVMRVSLTVWPDPIATAVALVHDAIEDAKNPQLIYERIVTDLGRDIATKALHMTRKHGQTYDRYIEEISLDDVCRKVKIADITDNTLPDRVFKAAQAGADMSKLLARYDKALAILKRVEGR